MNLHTGTMEALAEQAADFMEAELQKSPLPLVCVASGDTPRALYTELVRRHHERKAMERWHFIGLDEWLGLAADAEGSCRFMINRDLFVPAGIAEDRIHFFDGLAADTDLECHRMESVIQGMGGLDIALLGLGMNGHIGLNEPGTAAESRTHRTRLAEKTRQVGQKYFSSPRELQEGITLGLGTLQEARHLVLLVNGAHKASILKQALEGPVTTELPASVLRHHPRFQVYADLAAGEALTINRRPQ